MSQRDQVCRIIAKAIEEDRKAAVEATQRAKEYLADHVADVLRFEDDADVGIPPSRSSVTTRRALADADPVPEKGLEVKDWDVSEDTTPTPNGTDRPPNSGSSALDGSRNGRGAAGPARNRPSLEPIPRRISANAIANGPLRRPDQTPVLVVPRQTTPPPPDADPVIFVKEKSKAPDAFVEDLVVLQDVVDPPTDPDAVSTFQNHTF